LNHYELLPIIGSKMRIKIQYHLDKLCWKI